MNVGYNFTYMNDGYKRARLDGVCATALKLDTMSLETLCLEGNDVTSCGIAALAEGLQGPCTFLAAPQRLSA
jgi:hypothetical protein